MPIKYHKHAQRTHTSHAKRTLFVSTAALLLALTTVAWLPASASARQGSDDTTSDSSSSSMNANEDNHGGGSGSGSGRNSVEPVHRSSDKASMPANSDDSDERRAGQIKSETERNAQDARSKADKLRTELEDRKNKKLDDARLKVCQKRENGIDMIMGRVGERSQKQLDFYTTVSTRVQAFVTNKKLTVANYDQLVADIAAKKVAAQAAVDKVKADKAGFKCDGTDPVGSGDLFKADAKAQSEALKAYRASIKVMLAAVKAAAQAAAPAPAPTTGDN